MKKRKVKLMDEEFSVIGFGCWGLSGPGSWNNSSDEESIKAVNTAVELGVNFFDVAPVYGFGHAEEILGKALAGKRHDVLIGTKCGLIWDDQYRIINNLTPESVFKEIDDRLRRLGTDYIDIYQLHWPDHNTPIEDTMEALVKIKESGKVRHIGVSNFPVQLTLKAMEYVPIVSQQCLYNMIQRNFDSYHATALEYRTEDEIIPLCKENGQAFFPYSPLFQGLLTDKSKGGLDFDENDVRYNNPQLKGENLKKNLKIVEKLRALSNKIGKPLSQLAINWLLKNEAVTSVICGIQSAHDIEENVASLSWEIDDDMLKEINQILNGG